jgi:hypothetical protein
LFTFERGFPSGITSVVDRELLERLVAKAHRFCDTLQPGECWRPTRGRMNGDYGGYVWLAFGEARRGAAPLRPAPSWLEGNRGRKFAVHRAVVALRDGLDYEDHSWEARHTCDVPPCVNGEHLLAGTHLENMIDAQSRGRLVGGSQRPLVHGYVVPYFPR